VRENEFTKLPLEDLRKEYQKRCSELHTALVGGALWDEVRDQRVTVTRIAQEIHWRTQQMSNPAESSIRNDPDRDSTDMLL
jgi:hypothetical protein